jgi:serine/threonine protein kinase/tetratricopeptide (TPR) repeat protein
MPDTYGRFRVTRQIGEGGMGVVYAAYDEQLDRSVAIKTWRSQGDASARARLLREARAAASVSHPNICQLYDLGEHEGEIYIAMELLEGEPLSARIARGALAVSEAIQIALPVLAALEALHRRGIVHRDLKPSNIFLTPFGVKLLDFGLARAAGDALPADETLAVTMAGTIVGTPHYLAPEQLRGEPFDHRADLFAAGAVLYEMLTGHLAFGAPGRTIAQVFHAILSEQPPALGGGVAIAAIDRVVHRALQKNPAQRYESAAAMADDVRAVMRLSESGQIAQAQRLRRLIVLPFRVLRADAETDFLAFSLADAITSSLSMIDSLVVRSTVTASQFDAATADLETVASRADVDLILTGTLLRAGDQLRVNTQLVEAPAGTVVCSHSSQVPLGDIFALQDELSRRVVDALALPLSAGEEQRLARDIPATAKAYEYYLRANELNAKPANWKVARDLYLACIAEDPNYAPAWARLGRLNRVLATYSGDDAADYYQQAKDAFTRALELNPDLPLAHNLYTNLEVELGQAESAMLRLLSRAHQRTGDPELFAGLVQACRYCGLLDASVAAYEHARRLEPLARTSVAHSYFALGDYERAIAATHDEPLDTYALAALGRTSEAIARARELEEASLPTLYRSYVRGLRCLFEGNRTEAAEAFAIVTGRSPVRDPCALYYLGRIMAYLGDSTRALDYLGRAVKGGFFCFPWMTRDPWVDSLRHLPAFRRLLDDCESRHRQALDAFVRAGGDRLLGLSAGRRQEPGA